MYQFQIKQWMQKYQNKQVYAVPGGKKWYINFRKYFFFNVN